MLLSYKKMKSAIYNNLNRPKKYYAKWNKSSGERYYIISLMWCIQNKQQQTQQKQIRRSREQNSSYQREGRRVKWVERINSMVMETNVWYEHTEVKILYT